MFCLLCNSEEELFDGLCKKCYLDEFEAVKLPDYVTFSVCSHCGATLKHDKWIQAGYYDDEIIADAITKDITINEKLEDPEFYVEILNNRNTVYDCLIHISGSILNEYIEKDYPIEVKVERSVCPDCSKFYSGYYEAVIQLRADERRLTDDEIRRADEFISSEIQRLSKTNKLAYVTKRIVLKEGVDYQVGSYNAAHKICVNMQKQFGGIITESHKIVGHDKSKSKDLYRAWISLRLPAFHRDDFIEYENEIYQVKTIGSHKFTTIKLDDYEEVAISWKQYDKIKKVATPSDIKTTIITNITPKYIQVLDPDTFDVVDLKLQKYMSGLEISQEVNVIKIKDKIYILV